MSSEVPVFNPLLRIEEDRFNKIKAKAEADFTEFKKLCEKAKAGKTKEVLNAVDKDEKLINRVDICKNTLLDFACRCKHDNPELVKALLKRGADVNAFNRYGWVPLMTASKRGHVGSCAVLLDYGSDPNFHNCFRNALILAAERDYFEVCNLLISRGSSLKRLEWFFNKNKKFGTGIISGRIISKCRKITKEKRYTTIMTLFKQESRWTRRWPFMSVMVGCGFRPLAAQLIELELQRIVLTSAGELPPGTVIDTSEKRRTYYMGMVFGIDGLLRLIVMFL